MMRNGKKGQAALEYLVTYGWAILAIVIVAAILWYFGIFNPSKYAGSKQSGGFATVSVIDYTTTAATGTALVNMTFGNAAGSTLNSIDVRVKGPAAGALWVSTFCVPSTAVAGNSQFNCYHSNNTFASGDQLSVMVNYTSALSNLAHSEIGFVRAI